MIQQSHRFAKKFETPKEHYAWFEPIGRALRERVMPSVKKAAARWEGKVDVKIRDSCTEFDFFGERASTFPAISISVHSPNGYIHGSIESSEPDTVVFGGYLGGYREQRVLPLHKFTDSKIEEFFDEVIDASLNSSPKPPPRPYVPSTFIISDLGQLAFRYRQPLIIPGWIGALIGIAVMAIIIAICDR